MTTTLYDFEDHGDGYVIAPFVASLSDPDSTNVIPIGTAGNEVYFGTGAPDGIASVAIVAGLQDSFAQAIFDNTWAEAGSISFAYSVSGVEDVDALTVSIDGDTVLLVKHMGGPWATFTHAVSAGPHQLIVDYSHYSATDDNGLFGAIVDNLTVVDGDPGGGGGGPVEPGTGYKRGDWLRHLGGLYICRVDGASTEPGPGDSADWFEAVARPAAVAPYTPDARDLPVRAAMTNPFDPGEAGLWLVLDADSNVTGQTYVDGT